MGTIADKLQAIATSKAAIKAALTARGREPSDVLSSYGDEILAIEGGGGDDPYMGLRPSDWLPMPETVNDNEFYMLFHLAPTDENLIAFTVGSTGNYTVALGTMVDGAFVQESAATVAGSTKYENVMDYADWGDETKDGFRQVMIKISAAVITSFSPSAHAKKATPSGYARWSIVEIKGRLPSVNNFRCGGGSETSALGKLRFLTLSGENSITFMVGSIRWCSSLVAIFDLDTSKVSDMGSLFQNCRSLQVIPALDTSKVTSMSYMFNGCTCLTGIPALDTSKVASMNGMFNNCSCLTGIPALDTSKVTDMNSMFNGCYSLLQIPVLDTSSATTMTSTFASCYHLASIYFVPSAVWSSPQTISLAAASLSRRALVDLFASLPTIDTAASLTLTGNPGNADLSAADKAIATGKGWTLVL